MELTQEFKDGWDAALEEIARQFRKQVPVSELTPEAKEFAEFVLRLLFLDHSAWEESYGDPPGQIFHVARFSHEERPHYLKSPVFVEGFDPFPEREEVGK